MHQRDPFAGGGSGRCGGSAGGLGRFGTSGLGSS